MKTLLILVSALLIGCSHATIAPHPVVSNYASADGNDFNSGIISSDDHGFIVTKHFLDRHGYHFWDTVKKVGANYLITAQQMDDAIAMDQKRKNAHN